MIIAKLHHHSNIFGQYDKKKKNVCSARCIKLIKSDSKDFYIVNIHHKILKDLVKLKTGVTAAKNSALPPKELIIFENSWFKL